MSISILGIFVADLAFFAEKIPSMGETIIGKKYIIGPGGKGSNQAVAAAKAAASFQLATSGYASAESLTPALVTTTRVYTPVNPDSCHVPTASPRLGLLSSSSHAENSIIPSIMSDDILKILDFIIAPYMYSFKIRYTNNFHAK